MTGLLLNMKNNIDINKDKNITADNIDKIILRILQDDFPLCERPFAKIAEILTSKFKNECEIININEKFIIGRIKKLYKNNFIRRLGPIFDAKQLGYISTLAAVSVEPQNIERVSSIINSYKEVTHNYLRDDNFNIWFTVTAENEQLLIDILNEIKIKTGVSEILDLRAKKMHKIKVNLEV